MPTPRNALYLFVAMLSLAVVACQPSDPIVEAGARVTHPVIQVPDGKTLLAPARPGVLQAASLT
ncbi:MAG: hypothetical protein ABI696_01415 [Rubrivivax sp.]